MNLNQIQRGKGSVSHKQDKIQRLKEPEKNKNTLDSENGGNRKRASVISDITQGHLSCNDAFPCERSINIVITCISQCDYV